MIKLKAYFLTISFFFVALGPSLFSAELNLKPRNIRYFYTEKTCDEVESILEEVERKLEEGRNEIHQALHCVLCSKIFTREKRLREHLCSEHYGKYYLCANCKVFVGSHNGAKQHQLMCTDKKESVPQSAMKEIWLAEPAKWIEIDNIVENTQKLAGRFTCSLSNCDGAVFSRKRGLKRHIVTIHMKRKYVCSLCKKESETLKGFYNHLEEPCPQLLEKIAAGEHSTLYCSEVWNDAQYGGWYEANSCYEEGYETEEESDDAPPSHEDASGIVPESEITHFYFHKRENNLLFYDTLNDDDVQNYKVAIANHMAEVEDNKCLLCSEGPFENRANLKRHVKTDHYNMRYLCTHCGVYIASSDASRSRHGELCGKREFEKIYICSYPADEDLNKFVHSSKKNSAGSGLFICPIASCNKVVDISRDAKNSDKKALESLREHIACKHMGRKYTCHDCKGRFQKLALFNRHVRLKHKGLVKKGRNENTFVMEVWRYEEGLLESLKRPDEYAAIIQQGVSKREKSAAASSAAASASALDGSLSWA